MSHSSSRNKAQDNSLPLTHRASHARGCVNHVANRLGTTREELLTRIESETGVNLISPQSENELITALNYIESL